jgi:hypothetical protein
MCENIIWLFVLGWLLSVSRSSVSSISLQMTKFHFSLQALSYPATTFETTQSLPVWQPDLHVFQKLWPRLLVLLDQPTQQRHDRANWRWKFWMIQVFYISKASLMMPRMWAQRDKSFCGLCANIPYSFRCFDVVTSHVTAVCIQFGTNKHVCWQSRWEKKIPQIHSIVLQSTFFLKSCPKPGIVAHTYNPTYSESRDCEDQCLRPRLGKKF